MSARLEQEFADELDRLDPRERARMLRNLRTKTKCGVSGESLLGFSGAIPADDVQRMRDAIEEDFERVDDERW